MSTEPEETTAGASNSSDLLGGSLSVSDAVVAAIESGFHWAAVLVRALATAEAECAASIRRERERAANNGNLKRGRKRSA